MKKTIFLLFLVIQLLMAAAVPGGITSGQSAKNAESSNGNNYTFIFQVTKYDNNIADAVGFIFNKLVKPNDSLIIFTPVKSYSFSQKTLATQGKEKLIEVTTNVLKRDITIGTADQMRILESMAQLLSDISDPSGSNFQPATIGPGGGTSQSGGAHLKNIMINYGQLLDNIKKLRKLNESFFLGLAETLKSLKGKKYLNILYQKQLRPIPKNDTMIILKEIKEIKFDVMSLFETSIDEDIMDVEKVGQAMKIAGVQVNFIYINIEPGRGMLAEWKELSADIYSSFAKLARATGGYVETTSKPVKAMESK